MKLKRFSIFVLVLTVFVLGQCTKMSSTDDTSTTSTSTGGIGITTSETVVEDGSVPSYGEGGLTISLDASNLGTIQSAYYDYISDGNIYFFLFDAVYTCDVLKTAFTPGAVYITIPYEGTSSNPSISAKTYEGSTDDVTIYVQNGDQNSEGEYDLKTVGSSTNAAITVSNIDSENSTITAMFDGYFESNSQVYTGTSDSSTGTVDWTLTTDTNTWTGPIKGDFTAVYCDLDN